MTKRFRSLFLGLLIIAPAFFSLTSCNDDDDSPSNQFSVDGSSNALRNGYVRVNDNTTDDNGVNGSQHSIYLTSEGLTIEDDQFEGRGNVIAFALFSPSGTELLPGEYAINRNGNVGDALQVIGIVNLEQTASGQEFDAGYMAYSGTVKVGFANGQYTFDVDVTSFTKVNEENDEEVIGGGFTAHFTGTLEDITPPAEDDALGRISAERLLPLIKY